MACIYRPTGHQRTKKNFFLLRHCHGGNHENDLVERDNFENVEQVWKLVYAGYSHEDRDVLEHDDLHLDVEYFCQECVDALGVVRDVVELLRHSRGMTGTTGVYIEFFLDDKYGQGE